MASPLETTLLLSDQQCSVLHTVNAQADKPMAYTVYGHRPAESGMTCLLGFNGEPPDPVTGHYLLGNGYRAFNPVLMRFNSPDSLSPFGEGGLNGYAYCGGDPVNRVDPTGHTPAFLKLLLRGLRLMKKPTPATNIKKIADGIHSFETASKNQLSLTFFGHGNRTPKNGGHSLLSAGKTWTPEQLYNASTKAGINFEQYKDINMVMCYSANGGPNSFIRSFSALTEKPVTGYINTVRVSPTPDIFQNLISSESARIRRLGNGTYSFDQGVKIYTKNPLNVKNDGHHAFEYSPVTYESTRL